MRYIDLGTSGLKSSVLGFGCSAVMGRVGRKQSLGSLEAAYEAGITFFDTARSYGYGESESVLGAFLQGRRDKVVLSTKFGILPVTQPAWKQAVKPMVRAALRIAPAARQFIRRQVQSQFQENQFNKDVLRRSLEESLRKLRTDYLDMLFMHAPPVAAIAQADLLEELERLTRSGKIRAVGVSGDPDVVSVALGENKPTLTAMQFPVNLFDVSLLTNIRAAAERRELILIANHPFGGTERLRQSRARIKDLAASGQLPEPLRTKLASEDEGMFSELILNLILSETGIQVVVPSMMKESHLRTNIRAISHCRFTGEELSYLRMKLAQNEPEFSGRGETLTAHKAHAY